MIKNKDKPRTFLSEDGEYKKVRPSKKVRDKIVLIDANALIHRAFHALPSLTTVSGEQVNAVYGFTSTLLKVLKDIKPKYILAAFDLKGPTFRHKLYKEYKATRIKAPQELYDQIPRIKELVRAFNVPILQKRGFEADDIIGTISKKIEKKKDLKSVIVTGDLDVLQLVDSNTEVYTFKRGISDTFIYNTKEIKRRFGISPAQLVDFKALRGDPSDNIPGVKGIGEKTAAKLIQKYGSIEEVYRNLNKIKPISLKEKLKEGKENAFLSKKLVKIRQNIPLKFELKKCTLRDYDRNHVVKLLQELGFKSLLSRIPETERKSKLIQKDLFHLKKTKLPENYKLIQSEKELKKLVVTLKKQRGFVLDTETSDLDVRHTEFLGISFSFREKQAFYVDLTPNREKFLKILKPVLQNPRILKSGHNLKFDIKVLRQNNINLKGIFFDTMLASYLLNPGSRAHDLDSLAFSELGYEMIKIDELIGKGKDQISLKDVELEKIVLYSCEDADITLRLKNILEKRIRKEGLDKVFFGIEMPLLWVLADMELTGVKIDSNFLKKLSTKVKRQIKSLERRIYKIAGTEFNVNSTQQLSEILFSRLKINSKDIKRTQTGYSTAASELEKLRGKHRIVDLIFEHRELSKLNNTYLEALPELVDEKTGRVYTNFNQTITATGRLSSSEPNLQNIPIRTDLGNDIRKSFIAEEGNELLSADYSQIELRIAAHIAKDKKMRESFLKGEDIHSRTAAEIFNIPLQKVTPEMRRSAKTLNFGILYGMGMKSFASSARVSQEKAREFFEEYKKDYQGIMSYVENVVKSSRKFGYVKTIFGRKRPLPDINAERQMIRAAAERMAINTPIQGTAADIIKLAMIKIHNKIIKKNPDIKMILQVHDELVFEIPKIKLEFYAKEIKSIMENICKLSVPLRVDLFSGKNWGEQEKLNFYL